MNDSLESMFEGKPSQAEPAEVVAVADVVETPPEPAKADAIPRDDKGKFAPKTETKVEIVPAPTAEPTATKEEEPKVDPKYSAAVAQANDERRKRQELEQKYRDAQARLDQIEQAKATPDVLADPEGYNKSVDQRIQDGVLQAKISLSVSMAKRAFPDYVEVVSDWPSLVEADPTLMQKAAMAESPAEFVYTHMQRHKQMQEIGDDPSAYRKRIETESRQKYEAEVREQVEADLRAKFEAEYAGRTAPALHAPAPPRPTPSLAGARSGGRASEASTFVQPSLENLLKR